MRENASFVQVAALYPVWYRSQSRPLDHVSASRVRGLGSLCAVALDVLGIRARRERGLLLGWLWVWVQLAASPQEWENRPITCVRGAGVVPLTIPRPPCTRGRQETGPAHVHMFDTGVSGTNRRRAARAARNTTALLVDVMLTCPGIGIQLAL